MIVIQAHTFTLFQDITVFNNDKEVLVHTKASMRDLPETICQLAESHHIYDIKLFGNKKFNDNIKDKIQNCYIAKYNTNKLKIEII